MYVVLCNSLPNSNPTVYPETMHPESPRSVSPLSPVYMDPPAYSRFALEPDPMSQLLDIVSSTLRNQERVRSSIDRLCRNQTQLLELVQILIDKENEVT